MCACRTDQQVRIQDFLIGVQIIIEGGGGRGGDLLTLPDSFSENSS